MPQNMQYVDGRMGLRTNFNIIHGARGGELSSEVNYELRSVLKSMRILNVTKCITFIDEIEKVACQ